MNQEINSDAEVSLQIDNVAIKCLKQDLILHSDYFRAMFEGSFVESNKKIVKLEGIDLKAMNIILALLWDRTFLINEEDILSVLQVSCMLQFTEIKATCLSKLNELLLPRNCLRIWLVAEQLDLKPLYLKAKSMSLIEFDVIKDLDCVTDLQLKQLCCYLGNINLQCKNEMDVFQTCMKWWYENVENYSEFDIKDILLNFLFCLDFKCLLSSDIQEIITYPDVSSCQYVIKVLECVLDLHQKSGDAYTDDIIAYARKLRRSKSRVCKQFACVLVNTGMEEQARKKQKTSSLEVLYGIRSSILIIVLIRYLSDMFMRKRYYKNIVSEEASLSVIYYDNDRRSFVKFLDIDKEKCANLDGFKMIGYKEFIFLFGGEYLLGKGNWNKNFWVYDVVREGWERKSVLPFVRRHFESCICGNYLYIIGGTGNFRVIQQNMFWYNYKEDKWSGQIELPCVERQLKCCCWNNQLFILSVTSKCGYVFDYNKSLWYKLSISTQDESVCHIPDNCTIFSYKNRLYIKGDSIIELKLKDQSLVVASCRQLPLQICCDQMESIVCDDIVHTLYKQNLPEKGSSTLTYEQFHMKTNKQSVIFKDAVEETGLELQGQLYTYKMCTTIFGFQHYILVENDEFVNEL